MPIFYHSAIKPTIIACLVVMLAAQASFASDLSIKIDESTLNEVAAAIEPLEFTGWHEEFFCQSEWNVEVKELDFKITASGVTVTGEITGSWCAGLLTFYADLDATGDIYYSPLQKAIIVFLLPAPVAIKKDINTWFYSGTVTLTTVDASKYLNVSPIKINNATLLFETGVASDWLIIEPREISLNLKNGFIEFESNAVIK